MSQRRARPIALHPADGANGFVTRWRSTLVSHVIYMQPEKFKESPQSIALHMHIA